MSHGRVTTIKHFDSKATVESYIRELPGPTLKVFFMAGWYMQNHLHYMPPVPVRYVLSLSFPFSKERAVWREFPLIV